MLPKQFDLTGLFETPFREARQPSDPCCRFHHARRWHLEAFEQPIEGRPSENCFSEVRLSLAACESPCVRLQIVVRLSASWAETWACPSTRQHSGLGGWLDLAIQFFRSEFLFMFSCGRACSVLEGLSPSEPPDFHWRTASGYHHRRTADRPGPQRLIRRKYSGIVQNPSTERRAAGGDRPRPGGCGKMRPVERAADYKGLTCRRCVFPLRMARGYLSVSGDSSNSRRVACCSSLVRSGR